MTRRGIAGEYPSKPDFARSIRRLDAWLSREIIDRVPMNFRLPKNEPPQGPIEDYETVWMDSEYQVAAFLRSLEGRELHGETFPIFCPNLGPWISSVIWGGSLVFEETTSYMKEPAFESYSQIPEDFKVDFDNRYFRMISEMTELSLEIGEGLFQTGYTDLHGGLDCLSGLRGTERLLMDFYDFSGEVLRIHGLVTREFLRVFDHFDSRLRDAGQLSGNWLNLPFPGRMHVPSCDTAYMMAPEQFEVYAIPFLIREMSAMDVNIFHVDGAGVARHLDAILDLPGLDAIQWVQGAGEDEPILKWSKLIRGVLDRGKSVIAILKPAELDDFIAEFPNPEGLLIHVAADLSEDDEISVLRRIEKW